MMTELIYEGSLFGSRFDECELYEGCKIDDRRDEDYEDWICEQMLEDSEEYQEYINRCCEEAKREHEGGC